MRGDQLVVAWGDGGVHQGPITTHPDGIEFYGKRYAKPVANANADSVVIVVLSGAERLNGTSFDQWLRAKMAADLRGGLKALQSAPTTRSKSGSLDVLSAGRTVQDQSGGVLLQIYYGQRRRSRRPI